MVRVYSAADVHRALPWPELVQALQESFVQGAQVPLRHAHALSASDTLLLMPAWDERLIITKLVTVIPTAPSTVEASVAVMDRASGHLQAIVDGEALTLRRTAATSALAARCLCVHPVHTLLVVGTGRLAGWLARAHAAMQPGLQRILIWGRRAQAAQALAQDLADHGLPAEPVAALESAVGSAGLISCATTATEPVICGSWLSPGTHLDLVGGFRPDMREVDDLAVSRSRIVVDTYAGALAEAGDLVQPLRSGHIDRASVVAELAELLRQPGLGRRNAQEITLFKSVGTALEDLAAARLVLARGG